MSPHEFVASTKAVCRFEHFTRAKTQVSLDKEDPPARNFARALGADKAERPVEDVLAAAAIAIGGRHPIALLFVTM